jgi:hypothetical protein
MKRCETKDENGNEIGKAGESKCRNRSDQLAEKDGVFSSISGKTKG